MLLAVGRMASVLVLDILLYFVLHCAKMYAIKRLCSFVLIRKFQFCFCLEITAE